MAAVGASRVIYTGSAVAPPSATYVIPRPPPPPPPPPASTSRWSTGSTPARQAPRAARTVTGTRRAAATPRGDFTSYYDPSRVIDLERMRLVKDMRSSPEFAETRGDSQTGDDEIMSPSESRTGTIAAPGGTPGTKGAPGTAGKNLIPIALAIGAFVLFGG